MSANWIPEKLLQALAVTPGDPKREINEIVRSSDHPLRAHLESAVSAMPQDVVEQVLTDPHFLGRIRLLDVSVDSREARLEVLLNVTYQELYERRIAVLRQVVGRPAPYDHPALADLDPDDDLL